MKQEKNTRGREKAAGREPQDRAPAEADEAGNADSETPVAGDGSAGEPAGTAAAGADAGTPSGTAPAEDAALELQELRAGQEELLRQVADARNAMREMQERTAREQERTRQYAAEAMATGLLPVLDDLERALAGLQQTEAGDVLVDGLELILRNWLEVFDRFDIERLAPGRGEAFDPHRHEAMSTVVQAGAAPNTVWELVQPGYLLHDRVLRPARVIVAQREEEETRQDTEQAPAAGDAGPGQQAGSGQQAGTETA